MKRPFSFIQKAIFKTPGRPIFTQMVFQCFEMKRNTTQTRAPGVPVATSSVEAQIGLTCPPLKFGVWERGQCDGDAPRDNRVITPESL